MHQDMVVSFSHPDRISIEDPLTATLRSGARRLLAEVVEAEVSAFVAGYAGLVDEIGPLLRLARRLARRMPEPMHNG